MKGNEIFSDTFLSYLEKLWKYILFSVAIVSPLLCMGYLFLQFRSTALWRYVCSILCIVISLFSTMLLIVVEKKKNLRTVFKAYKVITVWSIVIFAFAAYFRRCMYCGINKWLICIFFGIIMWFVGCLVILTMCHVIKNPNIRFFDLIRNNKKLVLECIVITALWFCAGMFGVTAFAMPGKYARNIPSKETVLAGEKVLRLIFLYGFIPLYILTFASLYEHMISEKE